MWPWMLLQSRKAADTVVVGSFNVQAETKGIGLDPQEAGSRSRDPGLASPSLKGCRHSHALLSKVAEKFISAQRNVCKRKSLQLQIRTPNLGLRDVQSKFILPTWC